MTFFMRMKIFFFFILVLNFSSATTMEIGTNFWGRVDWTGERPFKAGVNFKDAWNGGIEDYLVKENVWNPAFLEEIDFYTVLRFMDWVPTNKSSVVNWTQRKLPTNPDQTAPFKDQPGIAIEWMIDLCNRVDADMWFCVPHAANDDYHRELARLVFNQLKPSLKVYIEYSNEVWNFTVQKDHATQQGKAIGIKTQEYVAHRSAQMWGTFKDVFGDQFEDRVVKTICGQSTYSAIAQEQLAYLYNENKNPTGLLPDVYGTAPYFGAKGFDGNVSNAFEVLETDIFEHRSDKPTGSSRIDNVKTHYNLIRGYDKELKLVCYEGGQHITINASKINFDPRMYDLYLRYLAALEDYVEVFAHYVNCGTCSDGGCWGAKEYTGQSADEAPKYKALLDYSNGIRSDVSNDGAFDSTMPASFQLANFPNPFNNSTTIEFSLPQNTLVELSILDVNGRHIRQLLSENMPSGSHTIRWDATNDVQEPVSSGLYLVRLFGEEQSDIQKIVLIK